MAKKNIPSREDIEKRLSTALGNYGSTIRRFTAEKERFLSLYNQKGQSELAEAQKNFENKYFSDFNIGEKYENEKMEKLSADLLENLRSSFVEALETGNPNTLGKLRDIAEKAGSSNNLRGNEEYNKYAEELFSIDRINELVQEQLEIIMQGTQGFPLSQFTDYALGLRRGIFYRLILEPETKTYIQSQSIHTIKGYFAEAAVYKAFSNLAKNLANSEITFDVKAIGGQNAPQDFQFDFKIPNSLTTSGQVEVKTFYGQSKSWDTPQWRSQYSSKSSSNYDIGEKANLVSKILSANSQAKHSWSMMVLEMSKGDNPYEAMDKAVIWRLGHEMIWADVLMQNMINSKRYLSTSFTQKDYSATNTVRWAARTRWT